MKGTEERRGGRESGRGCRDTQRKQVRTGERKNLSPDSRKR